MEKIRFHYVWILILLGILSFFGVYYITFLDFKEEVELLALHETGFGSNKITHSFLYLNIHVFLYASILFFVGLEMKNWKAGIAAATTYTILSTTSSYFLKSEILTIEWLYYYRLVIPVLSLFVFAIFTQLSLVKKVFFAFLGGALLKGIPLFIQSIFNEFDLTIIGKLVEISIHQRPFLSLEMELEENRTISKNVNYLFEIILSFPLIYIYLLFLHWTISKVNSLKELNTISIDFGLSKTKSIIVYLFSHFGIFLTASGIFFWLFRNLNIRYSDYIEDYPITMNMYIVVGMGLACVLTFAILYRNFMLSFYLSHEKKIAWNYLFCQIPFIGPIIWIANVLQWKKPTQFNRNKLKSILEFDDSNVKFTYVGIYGLFFILRLAAMYQQDTDINLLLVIIDFVLICLFVFYRYGLHILIVLKTLVVIFILYNFDNPELLDTNSPNALTGNYFYAIAIHCVIYPIFFLYTFKVSLPKEEFKNIPNQP